LIVHRHYRDSDTLIKEVAGRIRAGTDNKNYKKNYKKRDRHD